MYPDDMKARVRRIIDILDTWERPDPELVKETMLFIHKIPIDDVIFY